MASFFVEFVPDLLVFQMFSVGFSRILVSDHLAACVDQPLHQVFVLAIDLTLSELLEALILVDDSFGFVDDWLAFSQLARAQH